MFEVTQADLEQQLKEYEDMYESDLETLRKDNESLIKSSENLFKARIEILEYKLRNLKK